MATKNNRRTIVTKKLLKTALMELMQEKQFSHITIKELCERADLNRTTFYLHYTNLEVLLSEIEEAAAQETLEYIHNIQDSNDEVAQITIFLNHIKNNSSFFRTLLCNNPNGVFRDTFLNNLMNSTRETMTTYKTPSQTYYGQTFIMAGSLDVITKWMEDDFEMPVDALANLLFKMTSSVVSGIKGA